MPKIALSDTGIRAIKPPEKGTCDYWDKSLPSFGLRVSQGGTRTFIINLDKSRRTIGRFPILSLAEARTEAKRIMAERTLGRVRPQSISFETALELFLSEKHKTRRPRTADNLSKRLKQHLPFKCQLSEITHNELLRRLGKIKTNSEHDHALSVAKTFFTWCYNRRYISENPTRGIASLGAESRSRVLTDEELKRIWNACADPDSKLPAPYKTIVRLLILTGLRKSECALIKGEYVQNDLLILPGSLVKNGREHVLPLGNQAKTLLSSSEGYLFCCAGRTTPFNGFSKSFAALKEASGVEDWTLHDLRRTYRTTLSRLKIAPHIAEMLLNHASARDPVHTIYDRYAYIEEKRDAVTKHDEWWQAILRVSV